MICRLLPGKPQAGRSEGVQGEVKGRQVENLHRRQ
jgi:hypothetical protein